MSLLKDDYTKLVALIKHPGTLGLGAIGRDAYELLVEKIEAKIVSFEASVVAAVAGEETKVAADVVTDALKVETSVVTDVKTEVKELIS